MAQEPDQQQQPAVKTVAPIFAPLSAELQHVDLNEIFDDDFVMSEWQLLNESLGANLVEGADAIDMTGTVQDFTPIRTQSSSSGARSQRSRCRVVSSVGEQPTPGFNIIGPPPRVCVIRRRPSPEEARGGGASTSLGVGGGSLGSIGGSPILPPATPRVPPPTGKGSLMATATATARGTVGRWQQKHESEDEEDDDEDDEEPAAGTRRGGTTKAGGNSKPQRKRRRLVDSKALTDQQRVERRERNREHAKRSRIRKKFMLESLLEQVQDLRGENKSLRQVIRDEVPDEAHGILHDCSTEESNLLCVDGASTSPTQQLMEPDFRLMLALQSAQQNFAVSDPSLPDNPIVYASQGFLQLTGYATNQVIGRNCRFLQGPGTDPKAVDVIRRGMQQGHDTSVCLLNYKADGTPFWNQFFVASLRDADGNIVNYVGVQCEVNQVPIEEIKERAKRMALLDI